MLFVQSANGNGTSAPTPSGHPEPDELARALEEQAGMIQAKVITGRRDDQDTVTLPARFAHAVASTQVAAARMLRQKPPARENGRR